MVRCAGVLFWPSAAERRWAGRPDRVNFLALLVPVELSGVPAFLGFLFAFLFNCLLYKLGLSVRAAAPHPLPTCYRRSSPERSHCAPLALHITLGGLPCLCLQQPSSSALPLEDSPHVHAEAPHCLCRCSRHAALRAGATLNALLAPLSPGTGAHTLVQPSGRAKGTLANIGCRDPVPVTLALPCSSWTISRERGLQVSLSTWAGSRSSSAGPASALPSPCGPERKFPPLPKSCCGFPAFSLVCCAEAVQCPSVVSWEKLLQMWHTFLQCALRRRQLPSCPPARPASGLHGTPWLSG